MREDRENLKARYTADFLFFARLAGKLEKE